MTPATLLRNKEIGWIHARKKSAGMTEDEYRAMLQAQTGKDSCTGLTWQERKTVLAYMDAKYPIKTTGQQPNQTHKPLAASKASIERKIGWQLGQLGKGWDYVYTIWENNWKHEASTFEMLSVERLGDISSALARTIRSKNKA